MRPPSRAGSVSGSAASSGATSRKLRRRGMDPGGGRQGARPPGPAAGDQNDREMVEPYYLNPGEPARWRESDSALVSGLLKEHLWTTNTMSAACYWREGP